ncbi:hypothetical protein N9O56_02495 [Rickettsiales bacterium]|nr:hypothetical protein [Rickettsiales bacterium]
MINRLQFLFLLVFTLFSASVSAQIIDSIHYSWHVFEYKEILDEELEPIKRCYIMSEPKNSKTSYTGNRNAYLSVTRFENERTEEVSVSAGFEYKLSSKIHALVGNKDFKFFTKFDSAWLGSGYKDKEFITEMLKNDFVKVRSDSSSGSYAVDQYSLKGFARAYKRMKDLCP